jgi:mevalonate kinase
MPAISGHAPGKVILFGEHAVVYGRPAIAVPLTQVSAHVVALADIRAPANTITIESVGVLDRVNLNDLAEDNPLAKAVRLTLQALSADSIPSVTLRIQSSIPISAGLGSGAAVSVALIRALTAFLGLHMPDEQVNELAFEVEKLHHGNPSGIDNSVVTYARPVYFKRNQLIQILKVANPFTIVVGDTGVAAPTAAAVAGVRSRWMADQNLFDDYFDQIGAITEQARTAIESGATDRLGPLMDENQSWLEKIGVSSPELETLILAARQAGAQGAKLCGAGQGGNMVAFVRPEQVGAVERALLAAGAVRTIVSEVGASGLPDLTP